MNLQEIKKRVGRIEQIFGVTRFQYAEGKAKGVEAVEVRTGGGLRYIVLPDRGMDLEYAEYKGVPFVHISPVGVVAPQYFEARGDEWLRSFTAGLLTTCGLDQVGDPCQVEEVFYPLHGRIANLPAEQVAAFGRETREGVYEMQVRGVVRQAKEAVQNLTLERKITSLAGENVIEIRDRITNEGYVESPFMLLYHMNFGYPFLDEHFRMEIPHKRISSMYEGREDAMEHALEGEIPQAGYAENVFFLEAVPGPDGRGTILAYNEKCRDFAVRITFPAETLPRVAVWKQMGCQDYVMAAEPCNNWVGGMEKEKKAGSLKKLAPGECRELLLRIEILEPEALEKCLAEAVNGKG